MTRSAVDGSNTSLCYPFQQTLVIVGVIARKVGSNRFEVVEELNFALKVCSLLFQGAVFGLSFLFGVDAFKKVDDLGANAVEVVAFHFQIARMELILLAYSGC